MPTREAGRTGSDKERSSSCRQSDCWPWSQAISAGLSESVSARRCRHWLSSKNKRRYMTKPGLPAAAIWSRWTCSSRCQRHRAGERNGKSLRPSAWERAVTSSSRVGWIVMVLSSYWKSGNPPESSTWRPAKPRGGQGKLKCGDIQAVVCVVVSAENSRKMSLVDKILAYVNCFEHGCGNDMDVAD